MKKLQTIYGNVKNITLSSFKISYLECPPQINKLVMFASSIPASQEKHKFNYQYGVCAPNAVKSDGEHSLLQRSCNYEGKSRFFGDHCVCKRGFEFDSAGQQCKSKFSLFQKYNGLWLIRSFVIRIFP